MNQIKMSKSLASRKRRNLSLMLEASTRCFPLAPISRSPSVNRESFSVRQLYQIHHNPKPNLIDNDADLLSSDDKQEKLNIRNLLQSFNKSQLLEILEEAAIVEPGILHIILSFIECYPSHRKIFVRSLGPKTTTESLHNFFPCYGEVEEAKVIFDKATGNSKGYGFVTFKNAESFLLALENPRKKIEGFVSFTSISVEPDSSAKNNTNTDGEEKEKFKRKIRVKNLPMEMNSDTSLDFFEKNGEIEEGPWGFDMGTGKSRGFAYLLYKNEESAKAALAEGGNC